jgi:hypothetical protein
VDLTLHVTAEKDEDDGWGGVLHDLEILKIFKAAIYDV